MNEGLCADSGFSNKSKWKEEGAMKRSMMGMLGAALFCFVMAANAGDNGDGTFTTQNLVWLKDGSCLRSKTWSGMQNHIRDLSHGKCDLRDNSTPGQWRMPTADEIVDHISPLKSHLLSPRGHYWTATNAPFDSSQAYVIEFLSCKLSLHAKDHAYTDSLAVRRRVYR